MKFKITTKDPTEAKCLAKATDMALVIFEFSVNSMRQFKHRDLPPTGEEVMDIFHELLSQHHIQIDDLIQ